jgi:hypothetical protein
VHIVYILYLLLKKIQNFFGGGGIFHGELFRRKEFQGEGDFLAWFGKQPEKKNSNFFQVKVRSNIKSYSVYDRAAPSSTFPL